MTEVVKKITQLNITGNVVPMIWLENIKFSSGKPDLLGVMLLAEIIYWYRATEIRDEVSGKVVGYKKKFKADKLQKNYQQFADQFGVSKRQVQDAIYRLRDQGLITVELRIVKTEAGLTMSNVPFFEPVPERIKDITYQSEIINNVFSESKFEGNDDTERNTSCNQLHEGHVIKRETSCNQLHDVYIDYYKEKEEEERGTSQNGFEAFNHSGPDENNTEPELENINSEIIAFEKLTGLKLSGEAHKSIYLNWREEGFSPEMILKAAELMCQLSRAPNLKYIDQTLQEWKRLNIRTLVQVEKLIREFKSKKGTSISAKKSPEAKKLFSDFEIYRPPDYQ